MAKEKIEYCMMLFGSHLFGDQLSKEEEDTLWENKTFGDLKEYLEYNHSPGYAKAIGTSQEALDNDLEKALEQLWDCADAAKLYRDKLIPKPSTVCYRGMGLPVAFFKKYVGKFGKAAKSDGIVVASTTYQSKRVVESWSTDYLTSMRFTYGPSNYARWKTFGATQLMKEWAKIADDMEKGKEPVAYIPCMWKIQVGSKHNCLFNPDFTDLLSTWQQREVLRFGDDAIPAKLISHQRFVDLVKKQ